MQQMMVCKKCNGIGKREMPKILALTYEHVRLHGPVAAVEFPSSFLKLVGITAINNRLARLEEIGLITRTQQGRKVKYQVS